MSVLIVTAVEAERAAVVLGLSPQSPDTFEVVCGGVGPVAAAISTSAAIAEWPDTSLVISTGIAGGFRERIEIGAIAVADRITFADLGARTEHGLITLNDMGLRQDSSYNADGPRIAACVRQRASGVVVGEILTLACMTGTNDDARDLADRHPQAIAEAMEGFGVAAAARQAGTAFIEIRAISNHIGRRDPSTWDMAGALAALTHAFAGLTNVAKESWS